MSITEKYASSAGSGSKTGVDAANAWDWATMLTSATAGDRVNFLGAHTLTANATFTGLGTVTSPLILRGYASTIGDGHLGRTNSNGPLITTNMPVITCAGYTITMPAFSVIESMAFTGTKNGAVVTSGAQGNAVWSKFTNSGTGASAFAYANGAYGCVWDCDFEFTGASGGSAALNVASGFAVACRCDGGVTAGVSIAAAAVVAHCIVYSCGTDAISFSSTYNNALVLNSTLVGSTSDGVHIITGPTRISHVIGCLITDNTVDGIYAVDAATALFAAANRYDRNGAATGGATDWIAGTNYSANTTSATQANEYENAGSDDYRLKSTSPGKGIGVPSYLDSGALQREEPAGGSGGGLPILGGSVVQ